MLLKLVNGMAMPVFNALIRDEPLNLEIAKFGLKNKCVVLRFVAKRTSIY